MLTAILMAASIIICACVLALLTACLMGTTQ